ncbi:hypothetical protein HKD31_13170 [Gluconobacter sp. R71646]|uniref:Uncharacterized protein n=2 Tax=Gluconobacter potus TaxID=2724927 RepID=A0ABR9YPG6_9PROT|nr:MULTISPECIES: hypothetical protein [Gluconobacter]MBF0865654.1 hypothetical protein [Gluconobacter sp. R71656]MBF0868562.1 hypothetical protein [Gluconobacter sp. R75628]MBF0874609.1 hypothetical protein [Gluconobacter sp. R75629]MBF0883684.1 hypothetical protein [Gluconobacter potus]
MTERMAGMRQKTINLLNSMKADASSTSSRSQVSLESFPMTRWEMTDQGYAAIVMFLL